MAFTKNTNYYREDTALIQVTVAGVFSGAQFAVIDGGHSESATELIRPGNMEPAIVVGGVVTPADVTCEVAFGDITAGWVKGLYAVVGKAEVTAHVVPKDGDGNNNEAAAITWKGILKTVTVPKRDSSTSAKAMLTIVFAPNEGLSA